jgi:pentatricopeptide repeat protein
MALLSIVQGAVQAVVDTIYHMHVELALFIFAVCCHQVVFGKYSIPLKAKRKLKESPDLADPPAAARGPAPGALEGRPATNAVVDEPSAAGSRSRAAAKQGAARRSQNSAAILEGFKAERRVEEAVKAFKEFPEKTTCLYNRLLDMCVDCKAFDTAEEVMAEASAAGMVDVVTYNTMIKAHIQRGQLPCAHAAVAEMRKAGIEPNSVTFNELLDATIRTNIDAAWALLREISTFGVKPNPITTSILLKSIQADSKAADVERAMAVMDAMGDQIDEVLLSSVIEACVRAGRPDLLRRQLELQRTDRRVQVRGAHTFGSLIRAYGAVGDLPGAWDAWQQMKAKNILPTSVTFGCMVEALVSNGSPEVAHGLIREAQSNPETRQLVNSVIYCSVLKGLSHQKQFDRVWAIYKELTEEGLPLTVATFNALVDACARCGQMAKAPGLLDDMFQRGIEPNLITYSSILKGYCQDNNLDRALDLLEHMKQASQFKPDEVTYNTLLDGCARQGLYDRGMLLLEEMEAAGVRPTNFTLSILVKLANRGKRLERCFELTEEISTKYKFSPNVHVYNNLIQACVNNKDTQRGMDVLVEMLSKKRHPVSPDARTYTLLLRGCVNAGLAEACADLLRAALGVPVAEPSLAARVPGGASALQLPKGNKLGEEIVNEVVEGLARQCRKEQCAADLLSDLRNVRGLRIDPKLSTRLAARMPGRSGGECTGRAGEGLARRGGRGGARA